MEQQTEEEVEHTEEPQEVVEKKTTRKKMNFTEEQLEKKRLSMNKAREFRNQKIKKYETEIEELRKEVKKKEEIKTEPEKVLAPSPAPKKKEKPITKYEYEEDADDDDDEEIIEKVITIRKKKNNAVAPKQKPVREMDDLVEQSYREQLQQKLNEERRRRVMADLFDF